MRSCWGEWCLSPVSLSFKQQGEGLEAVESVMCLQSEGAQECEQRRTQEWGWGQVSLQPAEQVWPADTWSLTSGLWNWEDTCCLGPPVCGWLFQQP